GSLRAGTAEILRAFAIESDERIGQHAQVVLGNRVAVAIAQAAVGVRGDVRDAVGGAFQGGGVAGVRCRVVSAGTAVAAAAGQYQYGTESSRHAGAQNGG